MNISHPLPSSVTGVSFSFLTTEEIRRISVKQITNPVLLDDLNRPTLGGLYDPALGPSDRADICTTCRLDSFTCPGHYGHIDLPAPVFHPLFMVNMYNLFRGTCLFCHRFKMRTTQMAKFEAKLRLLEHGLLDAAFEVDNIQQEVTIRSMKMNPTGKSGKSKQGETEDMDMDDADSDETIPAFLQRLNEYVQLHLSRASGSRRDNYKDHMVYNVRKETIQDFLRSTLLPKCQKEDCGNPAYTFRKEGHTKIIEYDLSEKQKGQCTKKRPDVLLMERSQPMTDHTKSLKRTTVSSSGDTSSDESEGSGDDLAEPDQDVDVESDDADANLPRAANGRVKSARGRNERVIAPEELRAHLRRLFRNEETMCALIYGKHGPFAKVNAGGLSLASADMFFMDVIPVSPTRFRPPAKINDTLFEHSQNELLTKVLQRCYRLRDLSVELRPTEKEKAIDEAARKKLMGQLLETLIQMQSDVNSFMDSSKNTAPVRQGKQPPAGVKQLLEKKEGLFRKNMMGKRVNYAARSVISPDVNIEPNEIGVPPVFARKLTFPEPVTEKNIVDLRQRVINGPRIYPGASIVEYEDGQKVSLDKLSLEQRTAIANQLLTGQSDGVATNKHGLKTRSAAVNKKVYRHLKDGDMLILNRQPTLHKPSMMCHRAKVLTGEKTIRMHYANCNSYNADFDGDEMNIHFPQNEVARAEAMMIANTDNQYLVPTSGNPLRGLIQDHVVAGVWMTTQDAFFTREEYFQLLYGALRPEEAVNTDDGSRLFTLPPTIWKPVPLWTGKQIISTVLKNITPEQSGGLTVTSKTKLPGALWSIDPKADKVLFMDGELLTGVLDKSSFGASDYGLVHSVYELYGADIAGKLLGILSRLFTKFLQHRAFTCRMDDLTLTPDGDAERRDLLEKGKNLGTQGAIENFPSLANTKTSDIPGALIDLLEDVLRDDEKMAGLDVTVKTKLSKLTSSISDAVLPNGLSRKFPHNHMQAMTQSGAKGSAVNARQISCALGQQELEGRRVPVMVSGKTLPSFKPFETRAIAGGYVGSRFLTGIKPQEFYFHCMAGREGLIDTAVKTSRSGYLQRCLIKHLEGIRVHYDNTVRGSDSSVYQFQYGGDSLDVTKQKHLMQFDFVAQNEQSFVQRLRPKDIGDKVNDKEALAYMKSVIKQSDVPPARGEHSKRSKKETTMSRFSPSLYLGSTSEAFAEALSHYIKQNPQGNLRDKHKEEWFKRRTALTSPSFFRILMNTKYMRSLIDPGEAVGLLASQGVGEPSTQMTLNTFHFAGHGAANVTLGIPRLREIVMTASQKPKTPSMTMKVKPEVSAEDIDLFCKHASRLTLSQVVHNVDIVEELIVIGDARRTDFTVNIQFFPKEEYIAEYDVGPSEILSSFGTKFSLVLKKEIMSEMKKLDSDLKNQIAQLGKGKKTRSDDLGGATGEDEDDEGPGEANINADDEDGIKDADDEGGDQAKRERQKQQQDEYEEDESDDDEELGEMSEGELERRVAGSDVELAAPPKPAQSKSLKQQVSKVSDIFQGNLHLCTEFDFNESECTFTLAFNSSMPKLLLVGIIERTCRLTVIREIPGIADCFQVKDSKSSDIVLNTNGSNFKGLWKFAGSSDESILEDDEVYSNDIYAILVTYGVEMARAAILREMSGVFGVYSIAVDKRHLELIADYMTFDGGYKPFNRKGISTNPSPLLKASYETTAAFLSDATLYGDYDDLKTPSGNIVIGRPNMTGTGAFDIVMPVFTA